MSHEQNAPNPSEDHGAEDAPSSPKTTTKSAPKPKRPKRKQLPPYKLLLHNDDLNVIDDVVNIIVKLTGISSADARQRTKEADETGVALLLVTHKERAELYQQQFRSMRLTTTIEPDA